MKQDGNRGKYDDIINLPHHKSDHHPHMTMVDRAAQFSPFAALTGYGDMVDETGRYTEEKPVLTESEREDLDLKLQMFLRDNQEDTSLTVFFFLPDNRKEGGSYQMKTGLIKSIDQFSQVIIFADGERIRIDDVLDLNWNGMA